MRFYARLQRFIISVLTIAVFLVAQSITYACPFCSAPSLTLSEQMQQADAVLQIALRECGKKGKVVKQAQPPTRLAKLSKLQKAY